MYLGGTMPTGSGGGHFSGGGGRFGGGHFGGSGRSSSTTSAKRGVRFGRPVFIYSIGRNSYYVGEKRRSLISGLFVFFMFAMFAFISTMGVFFNYKSDLDIIREDYARYGEIIRYAEEHPERIVNGAYESADYSVKLDKWCITYKFSYADQNNLSGYSFYVYSNSEIAQMRSSGTIQIAVGNLTSEGQYDSIEMTFKNKQLTDDGEYNYALNKQKGYKVGMSISGVLAGGLLVGIIVLSVLSFKKDETAQAEVSANSTNGETVVTEKPQRYCSYCGSKINENASSCPFCGAGENKFEDKPN